MIDKVTKNEFEERYFKEASDRGIDSKTQNDFPAVCDALRNLMDRFGEEQWDYFVEFDIPNNSIVHVVINNRNFIEARVFEGFRDVLERWSSWAFKIEFYDNIVDEAMVAGDDLGELFMDSKYGFCWGLENLKKSTEQGQP